MLLFTCFCLTIIISKGWNRYWLAGIFCLVIVASMGLNSLILSMLNSPLVKENLLILYGIESLVILTIWIFSSLRNKNRIDLQTKKWTTLTSKTEIISLIILTLFILTIPLVITNSERRGYSEFYFYETNYDNSAWRKIYSTSQTIPLIIVVENRETDSTHYTVDVLANQILINHFDLGSINPEELGTQSVILPAVSQPNTQYQFFLYKDNIKTPYRTLYLWIRRDAKQ
jgi:uncharacterized membrane protein